MQQTNGNTGTCFQIPKKSRVQRACDMCRRRKRRCDGEQNCSLCITHNFVCTYDQPNESREVRPDAMDDSLRVEDLKERLKRAEALVEIEASEVLDGNPGLPFVAQAIREVNSPMKRPDADTDRPLFDRDLTGDEREALLRPFFAAMQIPIAEIKSSKALPPPTYSFPPDDLLETLTSLYFDNVDPFLSLVHRRDFDVALSIGFHITSRSFANALLLVCALGALYYDDPHTETPSHDAPGTEWFRQVALCEHLTHKEPTIFDIQAYCLAAQYLAETADPRMCWNVIGFGLRAAQDIGLDMPGIKSTVKLDACYQEMESQAFSGLALLDIQFSIVLGRRATLNPFLSPPMPDMCNSLFSVALLQLSRILALTLKLLHSTKGEIAILGLKGDSWQQRVAGELDAALNTWFDNIPDSLRWEPDSTVTDDTSFDQSAVLHCMYYNARILIHRPFIPAIRRGADRTRLPSLQTCNTAARACIHVADIHQQRRPNNPLWFSRTSLFTSAIVLLLDIWGESNDSVPRMQHLGDIRRCIGVLIAQGKRWPASEPLAHTLIGLVALDQNASVPTINNAPDTTVPVYPPDSTQQSGSTIPTAYTQHKSINYNIPPSVAPYFDSAGPHPSDAQSHVTTGSMFDMYNDMQGFVDPNTKMDEREDQTVARWMQAPTGFGVNDWETYLGHMGGVVSVRMK
ncbi:hypothetical protein B0H11DRAFT_2008990 [Mycena galericulata]|nr:hypothetical protein B0H11DRAFT_2008990 [Mycena galericulata]